MCYQPWVKCLWFICKYGADQTCDCKVVLKQMVDNASFIQLDDLIYI